MPTQAVSSDAEALATRYRAEHAAQHPNYSGRVSELADPSVIQRLFDAVELGLSSTRAADIAGIHRVTLHRWLQQAEANPDSAYATFAALLKTRESQFVERQHRKLEEAADDDSRNWTARMTLLERRFPEEYGRRQDDSSAPRVVVQIGVQGGDVQVAFASSSTQIQANPTETLAITAGSDKADYVNQRKP